MVARCLEGGNARRYDLCMDFGVLGGEVLPRSRRYRRLAMTFFALSLTILVVGQEGRSCLCPVHINSLYR